MRRAGRDYEDKAVNLYDNEGAMIATCNYDGLDAEDRDQVLVDTQPGGDHYYIWNQRNAQWRLASKMVSLNKVDPWPPEEASLPVEPPPTP